MAVQTAVTWHFEIAPGDRRKSGFSINSIVAIARKLQLRADFSITGSLCTAGKPDAYRERPGDFWKTDFRAEPSPQVRVTGHMPADSSRILGA
jgi:hypothetical protein